MFKDDMLSFFRSYAVACQRRAQGHPLGTEWSSTAPTIEGSQLRYSQVTAGAIDINMGRIEATPIAPSEVTPEEVAGANLRWVTEKIAALRIAQNYYLDVRQVSVFQDAKFKPNEFPPLVFPSLYVEFAGRLRFNYSVPYLEGGVSMLDGSLERVSNPADLTDYPRGAHLSSAASRHR